MVKNCKKYIYYLVKYYQFSFSLKCHSFIFVSSFKNRKNDKVHIHKHINYENLQKSRQLNVHENQRRSKIIHVQTCQTCQKKSNV